LGESGVHDWEETPDLTRLFDRPLSSFGRDVLGAPRLTDGRAVSLAHCQGLAIAVLADVGRIGVDIEPTDRSVHHPRAMAERFFSPAEREAWMESGEDVEQFLRIWTRKEALGKAQGLGLDRIGELDTTAADACFEEIPMDGYIFTVCQLK
jgi:phosphopantetheinyl transferase